MNHLRKMSDEKLKRRLSDIKLQLAKDEGYRHWKDGGYDTKWHPNFKEMRKETSRIKTVLKERE